jgi:hypothetical protein
VWTGRGRTRAFCASQEYNSKTLWYKAVAASLSGWHRYIIVYPSFLHRTFNLKFRFSSTRKKTTNNSWCVVVFFRNHFIHFLHPRLLAGRKVNLMPRMVSCSTKYGRLENSLVTSAAPRAGAEEEIRTLKKHVMWCITIYIYNYYIILYIYIYYYIYIIIIYIIIIYIYIITLYIYYNYIYIIVTICH